MAVWGQGCIVPFGTIIFIGATKFIQMCFQ